jgi:uncharacterized protein YkwD
MLKKITYLFLLFIIGNNVFAQEEVAELYPFSKWDSKTIEKARSYSDGDKISPLEKDIIFYTNLARINPKLFALTYVKKYIDENEITSTNAKSLIKDLNKSAKLSVLDFNVDLYYCARAHAESNGKKGLEGHQNYNARFKKYASQFTTHAENCDYGNSTALEVVMSLLIDEDVPGMGHRKNILSTELKYIGVAYAPHKLMEHNVVMCFGG